ncbi:MAG: hypothetical protein ACK55L_01745 [bacterium]
MSQAPVAFSGESAQDGALQGNGGIFLEQNLVAVAEDAAFAGLFCFGFPFGKFLRKGGFDETPFNAEIAQEMIDRFRLRAKSTIFQVAEDGGDAGSQFVLEGGGEKGLEGGGQRAPNMITGVFDYFSSFLPVINIF